MSYFSSCAISSRVRMDANIALSRRLITVVSGLLIVVLPFWNFGIVAVGRYDAHGEKPQDEAENENHHRNGDRIVLALLLSLSKLNNGPARRVRSRNRHLRKPPFSPLHCLGSKDRSPPAL